ncbi:MAG: hypothetical protein HC892_23835, partial [Saprospiraceae bacterium]|nr:hypothetical protein [Saprospiraceae bacterium]
GIIGGIIGFVIATSSFEVTLLQNPSLGIQLLTILIGTALGVLLLGRFMKILFNSPEMHIWHHAYEMPESHRLGINFGLTLAIWDYIWKTAYMPHSGRDLRLGFEGIEEFPSNFVDQNLYGLKSVHTKKINAVRIFSCFIIRSHYRCCGFCTI